MWLYHAQLLVSVLVLAKKLIYFFVCSWLWLATKHQMTLCSAVVALVLVAVFYITWLWRPWSFCILYHMVNATDDVEQLPFVALAKWNKIHLGPFVFYITWLWRRWSTYLGIVFYFSRLGRFYAGGHNCLWQWESPNIADNLKNWV